MVQDTMNKVPVVGSSENTSKPTDKGVSSKTNAKQHSSETTHIETKNKAATVAPQSSNKLVEQQTVAKPGNNQPLPPSTVRFKLITAKMQMIRNLNLAKNIFELIYLKNSILNSSTVLIHFSLADCTKAKTCLDNSVF